MTERNYTTVNPCVMCQPMGSVLAFKGVENTMVLLHGSQGCSTYMRLHLAHHFREPVDIASSALSEQGAVYGGSENLKKGLKNVIDRYHPKVIGVATTCMAETIGDDVNSIIKEFKEEEGIGEDPPNNIIIIPVSTPSYENSHTSGYLKTVYAITKHLTKNTRRTTPNGKVNIILGENISPADIREIKQIVSDTVGPHILLPDNSDTFDAPLTSTRRGATGFQPSTAQVSGLQPSTPSTPPKIPGGGTPISDITDMANSTATISLGTTSPNKAAAHLKETHKIPNHNTPLPIGLKNTDHLFDTLSKISGCTMPEKYQKERGRLLDAMVDVHKYLYDVKTAIYGDPDKVAGLVSFILNLGMRPVLVVSSSKTPGFRKQIQSSINKPPKKSLTKTKIDKTNPNHKTTILEGIDFDTFNDAVKKTRPDLLIGDSNGIYISKAEHIPLVRLGLPIHDRVGAQRILMVGYRGAMELLDRITNTILETREKT